MTRHPLSKPMASPPQLRVLERSLVSPPPGAAPEIALPLTLFDIIWLNIAPVERVFFYRLPCFTSHFLTSILPDLKYSLALALHQFYPLAGKIRRTPELVDDKYELHYVDGSSVSFTVAEYDADFDDVSGSHARDVNMMMPLVPKLPNPDDGGVPVLALQVTVFPSQGVAVGVTVHHAACNGSSSMRFMSSWASTCARAGSSAVAVATPPPPPIFDRSLVSDPRDLYSFLYKNYAQGGGWFDLGAPPGTVIASFALGTAHIQRLKELISAKSKAIEGHSDSFRCSTIMAAYAYVWVCLVKARAYESDRIAHLVFAADSRAWLRPPVPPAYFGNCLAGCFAEATAGELLREDGVVTAARAIGKAIEGHKEDPLREAETWPERLKTAAAKQALSVAGSPRFRVYDLDFGWGRPRKVEITSISRTGAMAVAESREEEGGVEIGMALPKFEMDEFGACFSNGL